MNQYATVQSYSIGLDEGALDLALDAPPRRPRNSSDIFTYVSKETP
jgi:hypothetical protein